MPYTCVRCGKILEMPLELNANYLMPETDEGQCRLVCPKCTKDTDKIIWGIDKKEEVGV